MRESVCVCERERERVREIEREDREGSKDREYKEQTEKASERQELWGGYCKFVK